MVLAQQKPLIQVSRLIPNHFKEKVSEMTLDEIL